MFDYNDYIDYKKMFSDRAIESVNTLLDKDRVWHPQEQIIDLAFLMHQDLDGVFELDPEQCSIDQTDNWTTIEFTIIEDWKKWMKRHTFVWHEEIDWFCDYTREWDDGEDIEEHITFDIEF